MGKIDCLERFYVVEQLCDLVINLSKQTTNTSFAIDGEWGVGKTFLLGMLEDTLKECQSEETNNDRFAVFHYNCWQYDYYEEPLVAIVSMMINEIEKNEKLLTEKQKKKTLAILKGVGTVALSCFNKTIESKTGVDINALLENIRAVENGTKETLDNIGNFDPFWSFNQALESMRESLKKISKDKTIVFVVDELDRCLPQYAIKILERLHHITEGIDNFITIIAIDKKRLLHSIADAFGYDKNGEFIDSEKYLKKFVRFYFPLDAGIISHDIAEKYQTYLKMFDESLYDCEIEFWEYFSELSHNIDMREREQLLEKAERAHYMVSDLIKNYDYTVMYMELLLTVFTCYYHIKGENIAEILLEPYGSWRFLKESSRNIVKDNLESFNSFFGDIRYRLTNRIDDKVNNDLFEVLFWYATFLIKGNNHNKLLSRDTSMVKGIDMEENLKFLYHFYQELIKL